MRRAFASVLVLSLVGCGTVIHGRDQKINISSRPSGAKVLYDGAVRGVSPCAVAISRRPLKTILLLQKDGYQDKELILKADVSLWALLGNVVVGGVPGWIIDAATGSFGAYYQDVHEVDLEILSADLDEDKAGEGKKQL